MGNDHRIRVDDIVNTKDGWVHAVGFIPLNSVVRASKGTIGNILVTLINTFKTQMAIELYSTRLDTG